LKSDALVLKGHSENIYYLGALFKMLGLEFSILEHELKKLKNFYENLKNAKEGYGTEMHKCKVEKIIKQLSFKNGSHVDCDGFSGRK
jgi:Pyruvate/2-oxoacid:ferredoxin oxidoreductase gamma subunit